MERWKGKTVLVTGASSGIGYSTAKRLAQEGMNVIGAARNIQSIQALQQELLQDDCSGRVHAVECDLVKDDQVFALFEEAKKVYGGVDVCINNAAISLDHSLLDGNSEEWREACDLNIVALCLCTKLSVASMRERNVDDGHIINVSSILGHKVHTKAARHFYTATKWAVQAITEGLRLELREAKSHIRASVLSPGYVETESCLRTSNDPELARKFYASLKCLQSEDMANSIVFMLSQPRHVEINDIIVRPTEQSY